MAINFPASPSVNDTFTAGSITYKWDGAKWIGLGVTPADRLVEGSNSLELDANNDLVYTAPGTLKVNSADASSYVAEFNQTNTSNSAQILINSPTDGESRPVLLDMARAGNIQWSLGQGYLDASDAFHISTSSLASGFTNSKLSVRTDGEVRISGGGSNLLVHNQTSNDNQTIAYFKGNDVGNQAGLIVRYFTCGSEDNRAGLYWQHENVGNMRMWMGDDLRLRMQGSNPTSANTGNAFVQENLNTTDNIKMGSGFGIDFSSNANATGMTSEVLNDYEHGSWTPTITNLGDHTTTAASTWGKYSKIGNRVWITWRYSWTSRSTTNGGTPVYLDSLPFTAANDSYGSSVYIGGLEGVVVSNINRTHYGGYVLPNNNRIIFRASGEDVSENSFQGSNATSLSSGYIYGGASYIV